MALTSQEPRAGFPLTVELRTPKLPKRSWVKTGQIRTLSTERVGRRLGRVTDEELAEVLEGLFEFDRVVRSVGPTASVHQRLLTIAPAVVWCDAC